jgi:uncharacterized phage protein (TIGR01671 family)
MLEYDDIWATGYLAGKDSIKSGVNDSVASVDPATVGQCTGLRAADTRLIFEGDILHYQGEYKGPDTEEFMALVFWDEDAAMFKAKTFGDGYPETYWLEDIIDDAHIEGNRGENPDMIA